MLRLKDKIQNSPHLVLILGFLAVILIGTLILATPYVTKQKN